MNTSFFIARRYLFSKKSVNAINIISGISVLGVFVGSAALVIILSVFNGFEKLVLSMYNVLTSEIRIEPAQGKTFYAGSGYFNTLKSDSRVANYTEVLQEKALIRYGTGQFIGLVKGVSDGFTKGKNLDSAMLEGSFILKQGGKDYAVIGSAVQTYLNINIHDEFADIEIYSPRKGARVNSVNPADAFTLKVIHPTGVFELQKQFDEMIIVPIGFARELLNEERKVSAIEISLAQNVDAANFQQGLTDKLGKDFSVKNRVQQDQTLYKTLNIEKWAVYLILTFVLIIAIFNIIGSLTMLVIDKRKDIAILSSVGAGSKLIRNIFFTEGMMIAMIGCICGILAGLIFCLFQQKYGFIKMGEVNMITNAYPIALKWRDFVVVFLTVTFISALASSISSRLSVKNASQLKADL